MQTSAGGQVPFAYVATSTTIFVYLHILDLKGKNNNSKAGRCKVGGNQAGH